ncbi:MAG TPA: hypothetical protein VHI78_13055, partial [Bacteroidales bacterium]|nr:hypothetical protein [Bacteroidales bacterium]
HYNSGNGKVYCTGNATGVNGMNQEYHFKVYPTVATSQLNVSFDLEITQPVEISIYDVAGRKLSVLLKERLNKGPHNLVFNTGSLYKNSVLLLQMKLSDKVLTEKIVIR